MSAQIANLLAHLDGSIHRACMECDQIFKVPPNSKRWRCNQCQCAHEDSACCDSPSLRTVAHSEHEDGTSFTAVACDNCGRRRTLK